MLLQCRMLPYTCPPVCSLSRALLHRCTSPSRTRGNAVVSFPVLCANTVGVVVQSGVHMRVKRGLTFGAAPCPPHRRLTHNCWIPVQLMDDPDLVPGPEAE
jgi:hypothetical protein